MTLLQHAQRRLRDERVGWLAEGWEALQKHLRRRAPDSCATLTTVLLRIG